MYNRATEKLDSADEEKNLHRKNGETPLNFSNFTDINSTLKNLYINPKVAEKPIQ